MFFKKLNFTVSFPGHGKKKSRLYAHKIGAEVGMQGIGWRALKPKD